jgi:hypothetical protein
MRKLIVSSFITMDGILQAPDKPEEGFVYGGSGRIGTTSSTKLGLSN